jgi:hypothetical protein
MGETPFNWHNFLTFKWLNRRNRTQQRRNRKQYTTRTNKHTSAYRAERKKRNKAALRQRKINRARCR